MWKTWSVCVCLSVCLFCIQVHSSSFILNIPKRSRGKDGFIFLPFALLVFLDISTTITTIFTTNQCVSDIDTWMEVLAGLRLLPQSGHKFSRGFMARRMPKCRHAACRACDNAGNQASSSPSTSALWRLSSFPKSPPNPAHSLSST